MTELPSYFEYQLEHKRKEASDLFAFRYDDEGLAFTVGATVVMAKEFDPYQFTVDTLQDSSGEAIDLRTLPDQYAILPSFGGVIGCPKLHTWAEENPDALAPTREVMHRALTTVIDNSEDIPFDEDEHGFMGYAAHNKEYSGESNSIHLQVIGNCACMGRGLYGLLVEGMEHGFAQYELHNADLQEQRVGLYAGLGHLAKLASEA